MSESFDVFISFKNKSEGAYTRDHDIAREIYDRLTANGLNVFFSEVSIQERGNPSYMKVINRALEESSLMILVGTRREHIEAKWVAQEWEAFVSKMNSEPNTQASIVLALEDMGTVDVPLLLRNYQFYYVEDGYEQLIDFALNFFKHAPGRTAAGSGKTPSIDMEALVGEAEKGDRGSMYNLGKIYQNGYCGVTASPEKAVEWFGRLADAGDPRGHYELATHYIRGSGVVRSDEKAVEHLLECDGSDVLDAYYSLGKLHLFGRGVPQSDEKGFEYLKKGADRGSIACEGNLGTLYLIGRGCEPSLEKAIECYAHSAADGYPYGQFHYGLMFLRGEGVEQSNEKAFKWFTLAAEGGEPDAQLDLGLMYLDGIGTAKSVKDAVKWLGKAAENGSTHAAVKLSELKKQGII